jgi:uncharacterized protein
VEVGGGGLADVCGVRGHDRAGQVDPVEQRRGLGGFGGLLWHPDLRDHDRLLVAHRGQQRYFLLALGARAAHGLAVDRGAAHNAVELEDLPLLKDLLDAGADVEDDSGDGWTLLRHAIDTEIDGHDQTGNPLHVDVTVLLLSRGADPLRMHNEVFRATS